MLNPSYLPRILFITPDVIFLPEGSAATDKIKRVGRGKKIDFFANLLNDLYHLGFDVHIVQPDYRKLFALFSARDGQSESSDITRKRLHLVRDRIFYYSNDVDVNPDGENIKISLAFQREVIYNLISRLQPDLIHCYDWMTGLIPAAARRLGIPCLFTVYDMRSKQIPLWRIEDMGLDAASFWETLFFHRIPACYEETRVANPVDFLLSGIYAADSVDAVSSAFASELLGYQTKSENTALRQLLLKKRDIGCISCSSPESLGTPGYSRDGDRLLAEGLYVDLPDWGYHVFEIIRIPARNELSSLRSSAGGGE